MPDPAHLILQLIRHVVVNHLKAQIADPLGDIFFTSGEVVVKANHLFT